MKQAEIRCMNVEIPRSEMLEIGYYQAFDRFHHFIREAQIILRDSNGPKGGVDKLCTIQLKFYPRGLAVAKSSGTSFRQAVNLAYDKMQQLAAKRLNKRKSSKVKSSQVKFEGEEAYGN